MGRKKKIEEGFGFVEELENETKVEEILPFSSTTEELKVLKKETFIDIPNAFDGLIPESSLRQNDPGNTEFLRDCVIGAAETFMTNKTESLRDERGLLKGVEYKFKENGMVDWRAMVLPEHIALNRDVFKKKGIDLASLPPEKIEELKKEASDKEVFLLLAGVKHLAELRGFTSVIQTPLPVESRAICSCQISWIPSFESEFRAITFSDVGGASLENTNGFGQKYLDSIAANRAFVRAVRNFLKIEIVASDEVGSAADFNEESSSSISSAHQPHVILAAQLEKESLSFDKFKSMLLSSPKEKDNLIEINSWKKIEDIPPARAINFVQRLQNREKAKSKD